MNQKLVIKAILQSVREQIQGLKERPDLAHEVPVSVAKLEAEAAELETLQGRHKNVGILYHKLTQFLQERAFRLRELFNRNTLAVGSKYGKYAPELRVVGAEPLGGARGRGKKSEESAPAAHAADDATVETPDAADEKAA